MRIIIIESDAFWVTEDQYKDIRKKHEEIFKDNNPPVEGYAQRELEMSDYLESMKPSFQNFGPIAYDFRL